jgi:two-component system response regulator GlrR
LVREIFSRDEIEETGRVLKVLGTASAISGFRGDKMLLVIDDDVGMRSLLTDVLNAVGYSVTAFSNATEALNLILKGSQRIDAVITDLNMPKLNGLDFLSVLATARIKIPVILITAFGTEKTERDAKARGAFGYLSKPFQLHEISALIQKAVAIAE